jgi:hypothetical protein
MMIMRTTGLTGGTLCKSYQKESKVAKENYRFF